MKKKIETIGKKVISYIGAFGLGIFFATGLAYTFDKWVCLGIILATILFAIGFVGGEECIPDDEK